MSRMKPIWNIVTNCEYKSSKSYGNKNTGEVQVCVGSSAQNSHELLKHITTRRFHDEYKGHEKVCVFKFGVIIDGVSTVLTEKIFEDNNGKAGALIQTETFLGTF